MAEDKLYLPVPGLKLKDLLNWQNAEERSHRHLVHRVMDELKVSTDPVSVTTYGHRKCFGNQVKLNDELIALFRIGKEVYAIQAECPHAGGPLYMADIEELIPGQVCLKCPWHKWTFDIDTGRSVKPKGRGLVAKTYPVRVDADGTIFIGFDSFGPSAFDFSCDSF